MIYISILEELFMLKAVLVDDEIPVLSLLERMVLATNKIEIIAKFSNSEQALEDIPHLRPDIVFLDVNMPRLSGVELATLLLDDMPDLSVVFVTAYDQYAIQAFKLNALHYLLKPITSDDITTVIERIQNRMIIPKSPIVNKSELILFGNMRIKNNGETIDFLTPKILELLALLVTNRDKGISKWTIIDALWSESSAEKSQQNLHTIIYRIKKIFRQYNLEVSVKTKGSVYSLELSNVFCDIVEYDKSMAQKIEVTGSTLEHYENLISYYEGDFLGDKDYLWALNYKEKYYHHFFDIVAYVADYYFEQEQLDKLSQLQSKVKPLLTEDDFEKIIYT